MRGFGRYLLHGACFIVNVALLMSYIAWTADGAPAGDSRDLSAFVILTLWFVLNAASGLVALSDTIGDA